MAAIDTVAVRDLVARELVKRKNWAQREPGVITVFAIVGAVALGLIALWIYKFMQKRKSAKQQF
ncbi:uncharacterized protein F5Z01DRAFT_678010 [Emericellopsis atlantica]|uniref:Uncharacterized protein n=1 Tax=Emericellopsis atlantica TaxID=2614577 RepID=A0A9P8CKM8_9HYPO|nr:uncharacterized protein F5Z01DRAFT_678010 [Emericellopsis atlantica]KAG9250212.1 hypothetical protein F5Z01DRAFT_678010 [Emericellopsis atlantica]